LGGLSQTTNDKVRVKVGTRSKIKVGMIGNVEIGETKRLKKIDTFLPMIIHDQRNQLVQKETESRKCSQGSSTRLKGLIRC